MSVTVSGKDLPLHIWRWSQIQQRFLPGLRYPTRHVLQMLGARHVLHPNTWHYELLT